MKTELIRALAKQLRLPTLSRVEEAIREAEEKQWPYDEFLCHLLSQEVAQRQENQLQRNTQAARFPLSKGLDTFQFKRLPNVEEAVVWQLATGEFVKRQENVILIGNPGTGKTHLAIGLGRRMCREGYRVRFFTAAQLVIELEEAQQANRLSHLERQLLKPDVLIVDELSYLTFSKAHAELLFHVLSSRNERGSHIITTNLEFSRWGELFPDAMLAGALVDRLTHRSHILNMNAESFRLAESLQRRDPATQSKNAAS